MSDVKKDLLAEIDRRILRKQEAKTRAITRNTIDAFVLAFISNVEEINTMVHNHGEWTMNICRAEDALLSQIRSFDPFATCKTSWVEGTDHLPIVNGVTVKWSSAYQKVMNCEPELFIDITSLLFS